MCDHLNAENSLYKGLLWVIDLYGKASSIGVYGRMEIPTMLGNCYALGNTVGTVLVLSIR